MTLLLKSDVTIESRTLTNKITRPLSTVLKMDFRTGDYAKQGVKFSAVSDALIHTKEKSGFYDDNLIYQPNLDSAKDRITTDPYTFKKGLLLDPPSGNAFIYDFGVWASKEITLGTQFRDIAGFRVFGKGAKITISNPDTDEVLGVATNGNDYFRLLTDEDKARDKRFYITVEGNPEYVDASYHFTNRWSTTRTTENRYAVYNKADTVKLNDGLASQLLPTSTGCLVIKIHLPKSNWERRLTPVTSSGVAYIGSETKGVYMDFLEGGVEGNRPTITARHRALSSAVGSTVYNMPERGYADTSNTDFARTQTYAINFSPTGSQVAYNGNLLDKIPNDAAAGLDNIYLSSLPTSSKVTSNDGGIIEQFLLLDEQLSDDELIAITRE